MRVAFQLVGINALCGALSCAPSIFFSYVLGHRMVSMSLPHVSGGSERKVGRGSTSSPSRVWTPSAAVLVHAFHRGSHSKGRYQELYLLSARVVRELSQRFLNIFKARLFSDV